MSRTVVAVAQQLPGQLGQVALSRNQQRLGRRRGAIHAQLRACGRKQRGEQPTSERRERIGRQRLDELGALGRLGFAGGGDKLGGIREFVANRGGVPVKALAVEQEVVGSEFELHKYKSVIASRAAAKQSILPGRDCFGPRPRNDRILADSNRKREIGASGLDQRVSLRIFSGVLISI
jgi:hypothetical protein